MHVAHIYDVNTVRDFWDWFGLAMGVVGALGAAVAIGFAAAAQRAATAARRDAVNERRRLFELDVLRELVRDLDANPQHYVEASFKPGMLRRYRLQLDLIEGDLPYWRRLAELDWHGEVVEASGLSELKIKQRALSKAIFKHAEKARTGEQDWEAEHARLKAELRAIAKQIDAYVVDRLTRELHEAIVARVEAGREVKVRRTWRPSTWRGRRFIG